jgi:hypothetical protein
MNVMLCRSSETCHVTVPLMAMVTVAGLKVRFGVAMVTPDGAGGIAGGGDGCAGVLGGAGADGVSGLDGGSGCEGIAAPPPPQAETIAANAATPARSRR